MVLLALLFACLAQDARTLVEKLRSEKVDDREAATRELRALGEKAKAELERAAADTDPEVAGRAKALLHELTPLGTLERIERALVDARSARIRYRCVWSQDGKHHQARGILLFKHGNRASLQSGSIGPVEQHTCDGTRVRRRDSDGWAAPANFQRVYAVGVARSGTMTTGILAWGQVDAGDLIEAFYKNAEALLKVSEPKFGPIEEGLPTLSYRLEWRLKPEDPAGTLDIKIRFDRRRSAVVRREITGGGRSFIEHYSEWTLDAPVDDDEFLQPEERIRFHTDTITFDPKSVDAYRRRGSAHLESDAIEEAMSDLTRAIELDPADFAALRLRARAWARQDKYDKATADIDRALALAPRDHTIRQMAADLAWERADWDRTIVHSTPWIELQPTELEPLFTRALTYIIKGDIEKALADIDRAEKLDPDWPMVYSNRALALTRAGRHREAIAQAEKALAIDEFAPFYAYAARGLARLRLGDEDGARQDFEVFAKWAEGDPMLKVVERWRKEK